MSMRCKQCAESFPKGQPYDMWEVRRQPVSPLDADSVTTIGEALRASWARAFGAA